MRRMGPVRTAELLPIVLAAWRTKEVYDPKRLESAARRD